MSEKEQRALGWCRDERLRLGHDVMVDQTAHYTLVQCVDGMHVGKWLAWTPQGKLICIGPEGWVRSRLAPLDVLEATSPDASRAAREQDNRIAEIDGRLEENDGTYNREADSDLRYLRQQVQELQAERDSWRDHCNAERREGEVQRTRATSAEARVAALEAQLEAIDKVVGHAKWDGMPLVERAVLMRQQMDLDEARCETWRTETEQLQQQVQELRAAILDKGGWDERCRKAEARVAALEAEKARLTEALRKIKVAYEDSPGHKDALANGCQCFDCYTVRLTDTALAASRPND